MPNGPGWEALFDTAHHERVLAALRAPDTGVDVMRAVPPPTLNAVRLLRRAAEDAEVSMEVFAAKGEVQRRLATLPPRLAASLFRFQRDGIRFALERNGRCLIADEVGQFLTNTVVYMQRAPVRD